MKKYIIVEGDTNDGDYVTEITEITDEEIKQLKPILKIIGKGNNNWNTRDEYDGEDELAEFVYKDKLTDDQFELMTEITPHGEYGIHTITSVEILEVSKEIKLL